MASVVDISADICNYKYNVMIFKYHRPNTILSDYDLDDVLFNLTDRKSDGHEERRGLVLSSLPDAVLEWTGKFTAVSVDKFVRNLLSKLL